MGNVLNNSSTVNKLLYSVPVFSCHVIVICSIRASCHVFFCLMLVHYYLFEQGCRYYHNTADPPELKEDQSSSTQHMARVPQSVPDVLVMSLHNPAFRMYENPDEILPPPYVDMQPQNPLPSTEFNASQPALPGERKARSSSSPAPPVPSSRRPSNVSVPRLRSQTDITPVPPVSETSMGNPNQRWPSDGRGPGRRSLEDNTPPPALLPRIRRTSQGDASQARSDVPYPLATSKEDTRHYANVPPISEETEQPNFVIPEDDDVDAAGYVKCVLSRNNPQNI